MPGEEEAAPATGADAPVDVSEAAAAEPAGAEAAEPVRFTKTVKKKDDPMGPDKPKVKSHTQINHFRDVGKAPPKPKEEPPLAIKEITPCDKLKAAANDLFKEKKFDEAIEKYGEAMADPSCTTENRNTLLVNRAMASLRVAEAQGVTAAARQVAIKSALADSRQAGTADPRRAKAHFREAQACMLLGEKEEAKLALHRMWSIEPGNKEAHKLLVQCDDGYVRFLRQLDKMSVSTEKKRENLSQMVHASHPMSLRVQYYKTWMVHWRPEDREATLSEAYMKVIEGLKENMKEEAREQAIEAKEKGEAKFGEDGFGVYRYLQERAGEITNEAFDLTGIVLEELMSEKAYNEPALYCATVERVAQKREDEYPHLTDEMKDRIGALRPVFLMGNQCKTHPLKPWMIREMGLQMRKQILIGVCLHTCMAAAGVVGVQHKAKSDLRNMRREARGLPTLEPGEESEDDEILNKTDLEEYQDRTPVAAGEALQFVKTRYLKHPAMETADGGGGGAPEVGDSARNRDID
jgi:tetratricopeptide (TPR) repeat protein